MAMKYYNPRDKKLIAAALVRLLVKVARVPRGSRATGPSRVRPFQSLLLDA
ncbi:hypothetical protein GCM10011400_24280 [Paraburkholderia caffeinilytica]|uniref:Transposase n=1 Tax=Paraburkholderia caffeinilytica TaxID=1761016 RepID=A0ABQ1MCI1_9BURK|nr:hypothetical protein GCM10011400_24280 [Paraburkholderia caffeinilytica]CAB3791468.1 hypothetical protein LMG28690_03285 [Paraburkholderia caffeinilytica]